MHGLRPPTALSEWVDLFEEELSIVQTTGLEYIVLGDFNIDMLSNMNRTKWSNLIQLFDLKINPYTYQGHIVPFTISLLHAQPRNCGTLFLKRQEMQILFQLLKNNLKIF